MAAVGIGLAVHLTIVRDSAEGDGRSLAEVGEFSADWADLVSRWRLGGLEQFVYVGWLVPVLAVAGIVLLWRRSRALASILGAAAVLPSLLALGTNLPLYEWLWEVFPPLRYPRVPGRLMPVADLAVAALVAVAAARIAVASGRRAAAATAVVLVLVAADLLVFPLDATVADPGNRAYAALRDEPEGRVLELPLIEPGVHYGSVYDYYQLQAPRERPGGYSTLVPQPAFDFYFLRNRISCGVWLPGDEEELDSLGIRFVTFHEGVYAQAEVPGAWFGWRELVARGYTPLARGGAVTLLGRGNGPAEPPVPEPPRAEPLYCEGWRGRTMKERQAPYLAVRLGRGAAGGQRALPDSGRPVGGRCPRRADGRFARGRPGGRARGRGVARARPRGSEAPRDDATAGAAARAPRARSPRRALRPAARTGSAPRTRERPPRQSSTGSARCAARAGST